MGIKYVCDRCGCDIDKQVQWSCKQNRLINVQHLIHGCGFDMDLCDNCYTLMLGFLLSDTHCKLHEFIARAKANESKTKKKKGKKK